MTTNQGVGGSNPPQRAKEIVLDIEAAVKTAKESWGERNAFFVLGMNLLGRIYVELGRDAEAERILEVVIELVPETQNLPDGVDVMAHTYLAKLRRRQGRTQESLMLLEQAVSLVPEKPVEPRLYLPFVDLADLLEEAGDRTERDAYLRRAIDLLDTHREFDPMKRKGLKKRLADGDSRGADSIRTIDQ